MSQYSKKSFAALAIALFALVISCKKPEAAPIKLSLELPIATLGESAGEQYIKVTASEPWSLSIEYSDTKDWLHIDKMQGTRTTGGIILSWDKNSVMKERRANIKLTSGNQTTNASIMQAAASQSEDIGSDIKTAWLELPAFDAESKDYFFITHDMTISSGKTRNFSLYYNPDAKLAVWTAYPLNKALAGSGSRSDEWGYDPKIPKQNQPNLYKSYAGSYDRGHQVPSADRLGKGINEKTFYFSNMTPQLGALNQGSWGTLESYVRNWSQKSGIDTLYVVTGADIKGAKTTTKDNDGKDCLVPTGYFKALLAYSKNAVVGGSTGGYIAVGFYCEHKNYDNSAVLKDWKMSIDDLEKKLGYDFFPNLTDKIGKDSAAAVESSVDTWWK